MPKCHYIIFIANSIENIHRNTRQYYTFDEKYFNGKIRLQQTYDLTCNTSIDNQYDTCQKSEIVDGRRGYTYFIDSKKIICYGVDPNLELLENFIKIEIISSLELLPLLLFFDACQRIVKQLNSILFILGNIY